jgi:hypothetical protein
MINIFVLRQLVYDEGVKFVVLFVVLAGCGRHNFGSPDAGGVIDGTVIDAVITKPNIAFVTSTIVTGRMLAATGDGIAEADSICNDAAMIAGLPDVGSYKAWLSSSSQNAIVRLQATSAQGWTRTDGAPVVDDIRELAAAKLRTPFALDEFGVDVRNVSPGFIWTGSGSNGSAKGSPRCAEWNSDLGSLTGTAGSPASVGALFTDIGERLCSMGSHLLCFGTARTSALQNLPVPTSNRIFLSKGAFTPNGRNRADTLCQDEANAANLGGSFLALLGNSSGSALSRLTTATRSYVRLDGVVVGDLSRQLIDSALNVHADGSYTNQLYYWTGGSRTLPIPDGNTCNGWANTTGTAIIGSQLTSDLNLVNASTANCVDPLPVLCVEQ